METMDTATAKALEALVGPLVAQGMRLDIAENVAKLRAFEAGTYAGEACDQCGALAALRSPWRKVGSDAVWMLCCGCSGAFQRQMRREASDVRGMMRSFGACRTCGNKGALFGPVCWRCAHRALRNEPPVTGYKHADRDVEEDVALPTGDRG